MKFGIREKILAAGLFGALGDGCDPAPMQPEQVEVSSRQAYDEAVKKCREKFPTTLSIEELREAERLFESSFTREKKDGTPWPNGKIPYMFADGVPQEGKEKILAGMKEWERQTGIVFFVQRTNETDRILFTDTAKLCSAELGKIKLGGEQWVQLSNPACYNNPGVVLHELGHAIGLMHEHQRNGWEDHVVVLPENVEYSFSFGGKIGLGEKNQLPYDFNSIMGYSSYAWVFSSDGTLLERDKNPSLLKRDTCDVFATAEVSISPQDKERVAMLYK